jgi:hypothetical protein
MLIFVFEIAFCVCYTMLFVRNYLDTNVLQLLRCITKRRITGHTRNPYDKP